MYKTLNNRVARFIIENSLRGNQKFTFIRLFNAMKDREFDFTILTRLFAIVKSILIEVHNIEDLISSIDDCPPAVRYWLKEYRETLVNIQKGGVIYD